MNLRKEGPRRAISPVVAEVLLIGITLIAAVALGGFVFGLFGSFTSTARVQAVNSIIPDAISGGVVTFENTGSVTASVTSISLTYGGQTCTPTTASTAIPATSTSTSVDITAVGGCAAAVSSGEAYTGSADLSTGGVALFSGIFP